MGDILYVSHCVPWPPDKGERIRAFHSVRELVKHHRVHLACLARTEEEANATSDLRHQCASVMIHRLDKRRAFLRALLYFAAGDCFTVRFYESPELKGRIAEVVRDQPIGAVVLLSSGMALYAPVGLPYIADWGDVDSEKRLQYGELRLGGFIQRLEGRRLRAVERKYALGSRRTFLTTTSELKLFETIAPGAPMQRCGNGVDFATFDPDAGFPVPDDPRGRKFLVFVGMLSYFPNSDGICRFAETVFPELRRHDPELELFIVGRNPSRGVVRLASQEGITVVGPVDDVRPFLAASRAVVVPLRVARGIQNKVLEALAMGKTVLASKEICDTFRPDLPRGIVPCNSVADYADAISALPPTPNPDMTIVESTRSRFDWPERLNPLVTVLHDIEQEGPETMREERVLSA